MPESSFKNSSGELDRAELDAYGGVPVADYSLHYTHIDTLAATPIKTSSGFLHRITLNKPVANGIIIVRDGAGGAVIAIITTPATPTNPITLDYRVPFSAGLHITTQTAAQDITVAWK